MAEVEIWHNPRCSKSRKTLALLEERGIELQVRNYLEDPPSAERIREVLRKLGKTPRQMMRAKEAPYAELGLGDGDKTDDELVAAMAEHPILIERPVVIRGQHAVIGRPPENVIGLL